MGEAHLRFLGAAENVTGSACVIESGGRRLLVDAGLYQEREFKRRNFEPFPVPAASIDAVVLTHAHLDHCGRLPRLVKEGFRGEIHATPATAEIASIVLYDAAHLQEEDVRFKKARHAREGRTSPFPYAPLYTADDVKETMARFVTHDYGASFDLGGDRACTFHNAGHILGAASPRITVPIDGTMRAILFSGDVGRWDAPILQDPEPPDTADYVVVESTYGDRRHGDNAAIPEQLAAVVNRTRREGGNLVIPSFAVERTQDLLYRLSGLLREDRVPHLQVFVDSPMAVRVTDVFRKHPYLFDEETRALLAAGGHPCDFPGLTLCRTVDESKMINHIRGTSIIVAGSGMCTGGRIKHHLKTNIQRPESTILFIGYQAHGTLGRIIVEGETRVRILGEEMHVKARIERISGFSAHADRAELLRWLGVQRQAPRHTIVAHGEAGVAKAFGDAVREELGWPASVAVFDEAMPLT